MHHFGIVHRDIKPENILMVEDTDETPIKLADFGLSKTFGPNETCNEPFGTLVMNFNDSLVLCRT